MEFRVSTFNPIYQPFIDAADPRNEGKILGATAANIWKTSGLPQQVLSQIWNMIDKEGKGYLIHKEYVDALKLIYLAQENKPLDLISISLISPVPKLASSSTIITHTAPTLVSSPTVATQGSLFLKPEEMKRYEATFTSAATNDSLSGDKCVNIFVKSNLPNDILGKIWNLVDTRKKGGLNKIEFITGMTIIARIIDKTIVEVPSTFPNIAGLTRESLSPARSSISSIAPIALSSPIPLANVPGKPTIAPSAELVITPADRSKYESHFKGLDLKNIGMIRGTDPGVTEFFQKSGLSVSKLAAIWNLADYNKDGALNKDEFCICMLLVQKALAGLPLPTTLPASLIPKKEEPVVDNSKPNYDALNLLRINDTLTDEVNKNISAKQRDLEAIKQESGSLASQEITLNKELVEAQTKLQNLEMELVKERADYEANFRKVNEVHNQIIVMEEARKDLESKLQAIRGEKTNLFDRILQQEGNLAQIRADCQTLEQQLADLTKEYEKLKAIDVQNTREIKEGEEKKAALRGEKEATVENMAILKSKQAASQNSNSQSASIYSTTSKDVFNVSSRRDPLSSVEGSVSSANSSPVKAYNAFESLASSPSKSDSADYASVGSSNYRGSGGNQLISFLSPINESTSTQFTAEKEKPKPAAFDPFSSFPSSPAMPQVLSTLTQQPSNQLNDSFGDPFSPINAFGAKSSPEKVTTLPALDANDFFMKPEMSKPTSGFTNFEAAFASKPAETTATFATDFGSAFNSDALKESSAFSDSFGTVITQPTAKPETKPTLLESPVKNIMPTPPRRSDPKVSSTNNANITKETTTSFKPQVASNFDVYNDPANQTMFFNETPAFATDFSQDSFTKKEPGTTKIIDFEAAFSLPTIKSGPLTDNTAQSGKTQEASISQKTEAVKEDMNFDFNAAFTPSKTEQSFNFEDAFKNAFNEKNDAKQPSVSSPFDDPFFSSDLKPAMEIKGSERDFPASTNTASDPFDFQNPFGQNDSPPREIPKFEDFKQTIRSSQEVKPVKANIEDIFGASTPVNETGFEDAFHDKSSQPAENKKKGISRIESDAMKANISELTGMGFSQEQAIDALYKFKNNLIKATNFLLDGGQTAAEQAWSK